MVQDQKSGAYCYAVRITVPRKEVARLEGLNVVMGMPVETFVQTGERNVISCIVKPMRDQIARAFREK